MEQISLKVLGISVSDAQQASCPAIGVTWMPIILINRPNKMEKPTMTSRWDHFRIGSEGYVSTLSQRGNGSYLKYGWGGLLADCYSVLGRFQPYAGLTLGGGAMTTLLMFEEPASAWTPVDDTVFHKQGFMAINPFVGCDYIVAGPMHLTFKLDYLCAFSESKLIPHGPRVYIGFLFYH